MATGKDNRGAKGSGGMDWGSSPSRPVLPSGNGGNKNDEHIPWTLLVSVLVLCIVLIVALPVMGLMYVDMNNATNAAIIEMNRLKEVRRQYIKELRGIKDANDSATTEVPPKE